MIDDVVRCWVLGVGKLLSHPARSDADGFENLAKKLGEGNTTCQ